MLLKHEAPHQPKDRNHQSVEGLLAIRIKADPRDLAGANRGKIQSKGQKKKDHHSWT